MSSVTAMTEPVGCSVQGCEQPAAASLQIRSLCREHFLFTCQEQLEQCRRWQEDRLSANHRTAESVRQFLAECSLQVADLALNGKELKSLERDQLLDILLRATDLFRHLRQRPRFPASIPVQLRWEKPGCAWEEQTRTKHLSSGGALLECRHPLRPGEILLVVRTDTGRQAKARVVWRRRELGRRQEIGIEFLDCENFWDLFWDLDESGEVH